MSRVFADPTAKLNATNKQRENKKNRKNAETNLTNPRRNRCTAQKRLCDHSPKMKSRNRFDSFQQFVFETVLRLIALHLIESRIGTCKSSVGVLSSASTTACTC